MNLPPTEEEVAWVRVVPALIMAGEIALFEHDPGPLMALLAPMSREDLAAAVAGLIGTTVSLVHEKGLTCSQYSASLNALNDRLL